MEHEREMIPFCTKAIMLRVLKCKMQWGCRIIRLVLGLHEQEPIAGSTEEPVCSFGFAVVSSVLWVPFVRENLFLQAEGSKGIGRGI